MERWRTNRDRFLDHFLALDSLRDRPVYPGFDSAGNLPDLAAFPTLLLGLGSRPAGHGGLGRVVGPALDRTATWGQPRGSAGGPGGRPRGRADGGKSTAGSGGIGRRSGVKGGLLYRSIPAISFCPPGTGSTRRAAGQEHGEQHGPHTYRRRARTFPGSINREGLPGLVACLVQLRQRRGS